MLLYFAKRGDHSKGMEPARERLGVRCVPENEMAHTVDLKFHQTTLESLENSFTSNLG